MGATESARVIPVVWREPVPAARAGEQNRVTTLKTLVLIPWPDTAWSESGRIVGRTPLPLAEGGCTQAYRWAQTLQSVGVSVVYSDDGQAGPEVADILATAWDARRKQSEILCEVDAGLWEGLTADELKRRYPKVYKRWLEDPSSIAPPEGERLQDAHCRIRDGIASVMDRNAGGCSAVVLGPMAFSLARCSLGGAELDQVRSFERHAPVVYRFDDQGAVQSCDEMGGDADEAAPPSGEGTDVMTTARGVDGAGTR